MEVFVIAYLLLASGFYLMMTNYGTELRGMDRTVYCVIAAVMSLVWPVSMTLGIMLAKSKE